MVYDKIDNIETYKGLSEDTYAVLKFLQQAQPEIENGWCTHHQSEGDRHRVGV